MKTLVLYDSDADGFGAAYAAWLKFGDVDAKYTPVDRGNDPPNVSGFDRIYILDFNYPRPIMNELAMRVRDITLLDHHQSAMEELNGLSYCKFNMNQSAAVMAWEWFHPDEPVPVFYGYIQDADLYQWRLPMSREVHLAVESHKEDFQDWLKMSGVNIPRDANEERHCLDRLASDGEIIRRYADRQIDEILEHAREASFIVNDVATQKNRLISFLPDAITEGDGVYRVPVVNTSVLTSDVCNELLEKNPQAKFSAAYRDGKNGLRKWGLRSRGDFDVSEICKAFGGGGHKSAGGFKTFHDADYGAPAGAPKRGAE